MFNKKFYFISRLIVALIFALGFMGIMYYQQHKEDPKIIEFVEKLKNKYYYSTDNQGVYTPSTIDSIVESFNKIFNPPLMEYDVILVAITSGNEQNIVFNYQFLNQNPFSINPISENELLERQKIKFCNNDVDLERLQHLKNYQFNYYDRNKKVFTIELTYNSCQNLMVI